MKFSKLLFALLLTSLIGFSSCSTKTETIDPKVGTWQDTNVSIPLLAGTYIANITFTEDNKFNLQITNSANLNIRTSSGILNSNVNENVGIYEISAITTLGINQTVTNPYVKVKTIINGSTAVITVYEPYPTITAAEVGTIVNQTYTMTKQ